VRIEAENLKRGYRAIKMGVGGGCLAEDVQRVATMRKLLGTNVPFMVDANMRWTVEQAFLCARTCFACVAEPGRPHHTGPATRREGVLNPDMSPTRSGKRAARSSVCGMNLKDDGNGRTTRRLKEMR
jgi:hypothetical protein